jgi:predicted Zn-ribbon and HTH transcriptional regulator
MNDGPKTYTTPVRCANCGHKYDLEIRVGSRLQFSAIYIEGESSGIAVVCPRCELRNIEKDQRAWDGPEPEFQKRIEWEPIDE